MYEDLSLTQEEQYGIYHYYDSGISLGCAVRSPLPSKIRGGEDSNPSFGIWINELSGDIMWKDHSATGLDNPKGDCLKLIMLIEGLNSRKQALEFYQSNMIGSVSFIKPKESKRLIKKVKEQLRAIPIIRDTWLPFELSFWSRWHLSEKDLRGVHPCLGIEYNGDYVDNSWNSTPTEPKFVYDISMDQDLSSWKIYNPLDSRGGFKWRSSNTRAVPTESWWRLNEARGQDLFICSGKKDSYCVEKLGFIADNPSSETSFNNIVNYREDINSRFTNVYILFDGDTPGMMAAEKLKLQTRWNILTLDYPEGTKDVADIVEKYGYDVLLNRINQGRYCP